MQLLQKYAVHSVPVQVFELQSVLLEPVEYPDGDEGGGSDVSGPVVLQ